MTMQLLRLEPFQLTAMILGGIVTEAMEKWAKKM